MSKLGQLIPGNLRKGDLFTRANAGQYLLMLSGLTLENCNMLISKILNSLDPETRSLIKGATIKTVEPIK